MAKRISKPQHIRQVLAQQINRLMEIEPENTKEANDIVRTIAYLSNVTLTAISDGELEERMTELEKLLKEGNR